MVALSLAGCAPTETGDDSRGLLGRGLLEPFPTTHLMGSDGTLNIPEGLLPEGETPAPVADMAWRTGFSPVQTVVLHLDDVNADALPSWRSPTPGEGGVLLVDLTQGVFLPVMAELDAHPDATESPSLLIRPQRAMAAGHTVAVVVKTSVAARPVRFDRLLSRHAPEDFAHQSRHYRDLMDDLSALGVDPDAIALAWDFPVDSGTAPLRSAIAQEAVPTEWRWTSVRDRDAGDRVADSTWRAASGWFTTTDFLRDDRHLSRVGAGVAETGEVSAPLYVHVPPSVVDAPAGSVPILMYGHGIFGSESDALDLDPGYVSGPLWLADELGFIVVATAWRGLDSRDGSGVAAASQDFWTMPDIADRMVQGQANQRALLELVVQGDLLSDPVLAGAEGQALGDPNQVFFWGNSMGAILGGVFMAQDPPVRAAALHTFGAAWSTLLERSAIWRFMEGSFSAQIDDPQDRQLLYAASQLWWDAVDPAAYADELSMAPVLLQENVGDDAVSNVGARVLVRSIEIPLLSPAVDALAGVPLVAGPLPPGSRAYVQFNPGLGLPTEANRPARQTGAHNATSFWPGTLEQVAAFLDPAAPGAVVHFCGDRPCSRNNRGTAP